MNNKALQELHPNHFENVHYTLELLRRTGSLNVVLLDTFIGVVKAQCGPRCVTHHLSRRKIKALLEYHGAKVDSGLVAIRGSFAVSEVDPDDPDP